VSALLEKAKETLAEVSDQADRLNNIVDIFLPFLWDLRFIFRCDNTRALYVNMPAHDRAEDSLRARGLDWRDYFLNVHIPGLEKWVFPGLDEETEKRKVLPAYRDLIEMLEASVHAWRHRVVASVCTRVKKSRALHLRRGAPLLERASAAWLLSQRRQAAGARDAPGARTGPSGPCRFFGVLRAGATSVPVRQGAVENELVNIARAAAKVLLSRRSCSRRSRTC
jgi:long-chain acyl-CoA synthetase